MFSEINSSTLTKLKVDPILCRYEKYWLPLVTSVCQDPAEDLLLAPPLDVHWVWHVHMLAPPSYSEDCARVAGRVVDHNLKSPAVLEASRSKTEPLWQKRYPGVPFELNGSSPGYIEEAPSKSRISYDIVEAALRQGSFYYQVGGI